MKIRNIALLTLVLVILGTVLSACGPSAEEVYAEKMIPTLEAYFTELKTFGTVLGAGEVTDPAWQADVIAAMDKLDKASAALNNVQVEVPESYTALDGYIKELGGETTVLTDTVRATINEANAGNNEAVLAKLGEMQTSLDKLLAIMDKANAEIDKVNQ